MLIRLSIQNFIIIDHLVVELGHGLNVFTGETGVGKSLIFEAIELLLGKRGSPEFIRADAEEAVIEGIFHFNSPAQLKKELSEHGVILEDNTCIIRRIISRTAWKNRCFINDMGVNISTMSKMGAHFAEIHGQFNQFLFLQEENHAAILDRFADAGDELEEYRCTFSDYTRLSGELEHLKTSERERSERADFLRFVLREIESAALQPQEEEELQKENSILLNAQTLQISAEEIYNKLYSNENSATELIDDIGKELGEILRIDDTLKEPAKYLEEAGILLQEFGDSLRNYKNTIDANPERIVEIEKRIDEINDLKKYGRTVQAIIDRGIEARAELSGIEDSENEIEKLEMLLSDKQAELEEKAGQLSGKRHNASLPFAKALERELADLMMPQAKLKVELKKVQPAENGMDEIFFMLSPNPGEGFGRLAETASGGELSRITLAIKTLLKEDSSGSIIFDEIDSGIGGEAAKSVGRKLKAVSRTSQLLCVTHLPQIASFADSHFMVEKTADNDRTTSSAVLLKPKQRIIELARMLNGEEHTDITLKHAKEMYASCSGSECQK